MASELPDQTAHEWTFEQRGAVGVWDLRGWRGYSDEALEAASEHYRERASRPDIEATLAVFGDETNLPKETQEYMSQAWSDNAEYAGVERVGFVSEGITAMAVDANVVVSAETASFDTLDEALTWARGE